MRRLPAIFLLLAIFLASLVSVSNVRAQTASPPAPAPGTWGAQLDSVAQWLAQRNAAAPCTEHCFVLTRLRLAGAPDGEMKFALEGAVLTDKAVAIPLFGSPAHARIDRVNENGKPAAVGFENDHWFVLTASRRFAIEGAVTLDGDLTLTIPGPLDALDAELAHGRVVEGAHLSALANLTVHFERDLASPSAPEPPIFQLSRALRIGRETAFEYHLVLRSAKDLGVVRLPLAFGEKVLEVRGSTGWSLQGAELVLPTAGRFAEITIDGALASLPRFEPDSRSAYEWWLVESDAEHRLTTSGDARPIDAAQSPIARTLPNARLFLVGRGEHLEVSAQALVATEALAAVVRDHERKIILTPPGDLVTDDVLSYENDGIDWLAWPPDGRAVFLGTDGKAERLMRQADGARELLVPLRIGSHSVHLQALASAPIGALGGSLTVPTPVHALTTSHATVEVDLPGRMHPLAVLGGDRAWLAFSAWDAIVLAASVAIASALLRGRLRRALGAAVLVGLWLVMPVAWEGVAGLAVFGIAWSWARLLSRGLRIAAWVALVVLAFVGGTATVRQTKSATARGELGWAADGGYRTLVVDDADERKADAMTLRNGELANGQDLAPSASPPSGSVVDAPTYLMKKAIPMGTENGRRAVEGVAPGVAPVALPLPAYERSVVVRREFVTRDRPLVVRVVYVTTTGLAPLVGLWLACIAWLARLQAADVARFARALRERMARRGNPAAGLAAEETRSTP
jgi:hypothetical protein